MIPTPENIAKRKREKYEKSKVTVHNKVSNTFIESAIKNNTETALKTIYFLASAIENLNLNEYQDNKTLTIKFDTKDMLQFTELTLPTIKRNIKAMQETSITFYDEDEEIEEGMSLLPYYKFIYGKHTVEIQMYVKIAKLVIDVKRNYSMIDTKQLMKMKSKHTLRMLPLLMRISQYSEDVGKRKTMTLAELNQFFGTNYIKFNDIERKILKPIQKELASHSKFNFIYETNYDYFDAGRPKAISITIDVIKN
jgi:plasmid replication initiation protein